MIIELKQDFTIAAAGTTSTETINDVSAPGGISQGEIIRVQTKINDMTNAVTLTFDFLDADDREIFELGGTLGENDVHNSILTLGKGAFVGTVKMKCTLSGAPGVSTGIINAKIYIKQG